MRDYAKEMAEAIAEKNVQKCLDVGFDILRLHTNTPTIDQQLRLLEILKHYDPLWTCPVLYKFSEGKSLGLAMFETQKEFMEKKKDKGYTGPL